MKRLFSILAITCLMAIGTVNANATTAFASATANRGRKQIIYYAQRAYRRRSRHQIALNQNLFGCQETLLIPDAVIRLCQVCS